MLHREICDYICRSLPSRSCLSVLKAMDRSLNRYLRGAKGRSDWDTEHPAWWPYGVVHDPLCGGWSPFPPLADRSCLECGPPSSAPFHPAHSFFPLGLSSCAQRSLRVSAGFPNGLCTSHGQPAGGLWVLIGPGSIQDCTAMFTFCLHLICLMSCLIYVWGRVNLG